MSGVLVRCPGGTSGHSGFSCNTTSDMSGDAGPVAGWPDPVLSAQLCLGDGGGSHAAVQPVHSLTLGAPPQHQHSAAAAHAHARYHPFAGGKHAIPPVAAGAPETVGVTAAGASEGPPVACGAPHSHTCKAAGSLSACHGSAQYSMLALNSRRPFGADYHAAVLM